MTAPVYVADTLASLRDSFALHLAAGIRPGGL